MGGSGIIGEITDIRSIPRGCWRRFAYVTRSSPTRLRTKFYDQVQEIIFPLLFRHQQQAVRDLFAPVVSGRLELPVDPVLIHGDLAPYHILLDPAAAAIAGVIDFGTAGLGDPATEIATLLVHYGERIVDQMTATYPISVELSERARFRASCLELEWALISVRENDTSMLVAHIGGARDYAPL
ncbi:MAG: aminoglycoside phosphotransferase family protein [Chloroflexota bacterium]|nr:aminoglycoside phosphotransferase family protein [Chloroflexota bacterium]